MQRTTCALSYRVVGKGDRQLVWLHGLLGSSKDFIDFAQRLSTEYQSFLVDLPGHGMSPIQGECSYATWSDSLLELFDAERISKADLVGYSMGGRQALHFALNHTTRIRRLVLESASPGLSGLARRLRRQQVDDDRANSILSEGLEPFLRQWYRSSVFSNLRRNPGLVDKLVARRTSNNPDAIAQVIQQMSVGKQPSLWRRLPELRSPTLLLSGGLDGKYLGIARRASKLSRVIQTETIEDSGHNIHLEAPDAYLRSVRAFLGGFRPTLAR